MKTKTLLAQLVLTAALLAGPSLFAANPIPADCKIGGLAVGCQAYSFNRFTLFEAIEKTDSAGGKTIEFFPRQKLSKEKPDVTFNHDASDEVIAEVQAKLEKHKIRAVNYGVVGGKDEAEWRKIFEFAKKLNLYGITTEDVKNIDVIEKLVKEFDLKVGYHEHAKRFKKGPDGKQVEDENYKIWDPNFVLALVKDRDPRIGACADTGHWQSSGLKPLDCIRILKGRIVSLHLKERAVIGEKTPDIVYGTGVSDTIAVLDELRKQKFDGHLSIEYENNWDNSVGDIGQCIGFVRGWATARGSK
ncbi:MAG: sugar phosphate isomerase/epimerase [Verrucomicrobia bacterium]|nr:sugar phosphate isomerase/epimerase [Verrucomicrobiota bacterium]